jgi:hypothetical protein
VKEVSFGLISGYQHGRCMQVTAHSLPIGSTARSLRAENGHVCITEHRSQCRGGGVEQPKGRSKKN